MYTSEIYKTLILSTDNQLYRKEVFLWFQLKQNDFKERTANILWLFTALHDNKLY